MNPREWKPLALLAIVFLAFGCAHDSDRSKGYEDSPTAATPRESAMATTTSCQASASWVSDPAPPETIPGGGTDFCQFYQFAWQWFLYLGSPSATSSNDRNFQVAANFPELMATGDSCTTQPAQPTLFVRAKKSMDDSEELIIPERIGQAGGSAVIYDQERNAVFYNIRFSRSMCSTTPGGDFPAGTTELKTSWRILASGEADRYFTMEAVIEGVSSTPQLLGLVGFHLFRTTSGHPEGVWMSWEHADNAPDCLEPQTTPTAGWSFASTTCAECLATSTTGPLGCASCDFNQAESSSKLTGGPTEICRVYRDGTGPNDNKASENLRDVDALNEQLVGPGGILTQLSSSDPMAVWKNYFNVGGLWVSDPSQSATPSNQRGSLQLTNTTMETTHQGNFQESNGQLTRTAAVNCFACHNYTPDQTTTSGLSHIFDEITSNSSE